MLPPAALLLAAAGIASVGDDAAPVVGAAQGLHTPPAPGPCACADKLLCLPLQTAPPATEIFAFSRGPGNGGYFSYDWGAVTSVAFDPASISNATLRNASVCWAHQHNARVILSARGPWSPGAPGSQAARDYESLVVTNATMRKAYIAEELARVWSAGADGLNFDIEGAEGVPNNTAAGLVRLFKELREASLAFGFKHFQVSLDNPIYPGQPQLAIAYNLTGLAEHIDFFMPMGYDMNGSHVQ